jgi:hypothetical protein
MLDSASVGNNGFLLTLPPGVEALGQVTPATGAPTRELHCNAAILLQWSEALSYA